MHFAHLLLYGIYGIISLGVLWIWFKVYFWPFAQIQQYPIHSVGVIFGVETVGDNDECALTVEYTTDNHQTIIRKCRHLFPKNHAFVEVGKQVPIMYAFHRPTEFIIGSEVESYRKEAYYTLRVILALIVGLFIFGYLLLKIIL